MYYSRCHIQVRTLFLYDFAFGLLSSFFITECFLSSSTAEFHSQTAIEAAKHIYAQLKDQGKSAKDIKSVTIRTHEACVRIIDKQDKPMDNFADRDHCIQVT